MDVRYTTQTAFPAIEDYAVVGNLHTVALIAKTGAIEFFAYPHFDSPTLFTAMLDRAVGGTFTLTIDGETVGTQRYEDGTNVLVTRLESSVGAIEITDFMPLGDDATSNQLVRVVRCIAGEVTVRGECRPAFDDGACTPDVRREGDGAVVFTGGDYPWPVRLVADRPVAQTDVGARIDVPMRAGERFALCLVCDNAETDLLSRGQVDAALDGTIAYWRNWLGQCTYDGPWREMVLRSALVLKLLFSERHGSMVAAGTFGLPEAIGGERNWDYRYCWIRDSAFTIYAMLRLGFTREAEAYRDWIADRVAEDGSGTLRLLYRLDGGTDGLEERTLDHLSGYKGSRPVRIGNAAFEQTQLDIYGEVIDSLYLSAKHLDKINDQNFRLICELAGYTCRSWRDPGSGMWEMRGPPRHFLDARLFSWVALDRALRLSEKIGRDAPANWSTHRRDIEESIHEEFWDEEIGAFTQTPGSGVLDACFLLMPLVKFTSTTDERFRATLRRAEDVLVDGCFVRRYEAVSREEEGVDGPAEGAFTTCSFWYIEVLARSARIAEARRLMDEVCGHASPVGLFSEELGADGAHLGNTPQALPHLALISAATAIERAEGNGGEPF